MRLLEKVAVITGAGRGIGRETALTFAREGAKVVVAEYDETTGRQTARDIEGLGRESLFIKVDVADREQVKVMVDTTVERFGRIDILVNNAGITADGFLTRLTEEQWDRVMDVNLKGVFNVTQAIVPVMLQQAKGVVLNASSVVGLYGNIGQTNYAASKWGVIGLTKSWAKELGRKGIRFAAVAPGFIESDMTAKVPEKVIDLMQEKTPLGRLGQTRDVANAYLFLASDEADFITGAVLSVDGGLVI
ncbi:MAG: 3-oxoacyl-[acyl-carrier-protein] reductase [Firmicutes bacterium]|nr:3-oxoacyl-[acyl-carrier-protein] reductase [Bacillota bacterium]MCL5039972.1 3-oxoacyl-[acyl-carrier-protein] reductase [Bacillota bacterium]